jgi:hypothetical protein
MKTIFTLFTGLLFLVACHPTKDVTSNSKQKIVDGPHTEAQSKAVAMKKDLPEITFSGDCKDLKKSVKETIAKNDLPIGTRSTTPLSNNFNEYYPELTSGFYSKQEELDKSIAQMEILEDSMALVSDQMSELADFLGGVHRVYLQSNGDISKIPVEEQKFILNEGDSAYYAEKINVLFNQYTGMRLRLLEVQGSAGKSYKWMEVYSANFRYQIPYLFEDVFSFDPGSWRVEEIKVDKQKLGFAISVITDYYKELKYDPIFSQSKIELVSSYTGFADKMKVGSAKRQELLNEYEIKYHRSFPNPTDENLNLFLSELRAQSVAKYISDVYGELLVVRPDAIKIVAAGQAPPNRDLEQDPKIDNAKRRIAKLFCVLVLFEESDLVRR